MHFAERICERLTEESFQVDSKASRPGGWFSRRLEPGKKRSFSLFYNGVSQVYLKDK
jgi:hypothetical protein